MENEPSVHDNRIIAYSVFAAEKRIVIQTEFCDRKPHELTNIVFDDVLAYHFENDLFGTIIFDVQEMDLSKLLKECSAMFDYGWRYGWPRGWDKNKEEIEVFVRRMNMRAFVLSASYGMTGWVLAKDVSKIAVNCSGQ